MTKLANYSSDEQADLLQNMSIEQLNELFSRGTRIVLNRNIEEAVDDVDLVTKIEQTGLSETVIRTIETDKTQAVLKDIIRYCDGLNISLLGFLQNELVAVA